MQHDEVPDGDLGDEEESGQSSAGMERPARALLLGVGRRDRLRGTGHRERVRSSRESLLLGRARRGREFVRRRRRRRPALPGWIGRMPPGSPTRMPSSCPIPCPPGSDPVPRRTRIRNRTRTRTRNGIRTGRAPRRTTSRPAGRPPPRASRGREADGFRTIVPTAARVVVGGTARREARSVVGRARGLSAGLTANPTANVDAMSTTTRAAVVRVECPSAFRQSR